MQTTNDTRNSIKEKPKATKWRRRDGADPTAQWRRVSDELTAKRPRSGGSASCTAGARPSKGAQRAPLAELKGRGGRAGEHGRRACKKGERTALPQRAAMGLGRAASGRARRASTARGGAAQWLRRRSRMARGRASERAGAQGGAGLHRQPQGA
ncbi:hypothetical protein Syun_018937 [Stephania yunnanensis]|uniref:Uncharacterized protein n=1 Tax=Stephania yunnanensis TaxID=152371 RepID=A0AAP0IUA5_9MAGN